MHEKLHSDPPADERLSPGIAVATLERTYRHQVSSCLFLFTERLDQPLLRLAKSKRRSGPKPQSQIKYHCIRRLQTGPPYELLIRRSEDGALVKYFASKKAVKLLLPGCQPSLSRRQSFAVSKEEDTPGWAESELEG